jgi:hypothetical protein
LVSAASDDPGGAFVNVNGYDPTNYAVVYDTTQRAYSRALWTDAQLRLTAQVTPKNKVAFTWDQQTRCSCLAGPGTPSAGVISATVTPEAGTNFRSPTQRLLHGEWSSPVNNRILLEGAGVYRVERWGNMPPNEAWSPEFITPSQQAVLESGALIPVLDLSNGRFSHGNFVGYNNNWAANSFVRATMSYVIGGHQLSRDIARLNDLVRVEGGQRSAVRRKPSGVWDGDGVRNKLAGAEGRVIGHPEIAVPATKATNVHRNARKNLALPAGAELPVVASLTPSKHRIAVESQRIGIGRPETRVGDGEALAVGRRVGQIALLHKVAVEVEPGPAGLVDEATHGMRTGTAGVDADQRAHSLPFGGAPGMLMKKAYGE